jgi:NADPH:quinone reductase-like Zn-dependent oxidoreductase
MGKRFPLAKAAKAHRHLESRQSTGKILLTV